MSTGLASIAIVAVGAQLALQAPINSALGGHVGRLAASLVSFVVGSLILFFLVLVSGELPSLGELGNVPAHQLLGGLIGATYVATATLTVARIGAGAVVAATIAGQLLGSLLIDELGLVGVETVSLDLLRFIGALLLIAGTLLVVTRGSGLASAARQGPAFAALITVFVAGLLVGLQHPLNGLLSESSGELVAALTNFIVGTLFLAVLVVASGRSSRLSALGNAPRWQLLGGVIGLITVLAALSAVSILGAAGLTAALVTGQLIGSIAIDRAGAFGLEVRAVTPRRALGAVLLLVGTLLCVS